MVCRALFLDRGITKANAFAQKAKGVSHVSSAWLAGRVRRQDPRDRSLQ